MAHVHLVLGPVGAGKSTYAIKLAAEHRALRLTLDDWMTRLFRPDRPASDVMAWYVERADRCVAQIWDVTLDALRAETNVVLEIGLIRRNDRDAFYQRVDDADVGMTVHVIDAPREVRRARVAQRNVERGATFAVEVPPEFFELASDLWEPPDDREIEARDIRFPA